jgi:hypothetical protein
MTASARGRVSGYKLPFVGEYGVYNLGGVNLWRTERRALFVGRFSDTSNVLLVLPQPG